MLTVHGMSQSGNCHKVRLLLDQLALDYEWREIDILRGESRTDAFLKMNPNGRVPVLEIEPGVFLPESNAILCYLADGTRLWPQERLMRARTLSWMFFEQYSHEPCIAVARFISRFLPADSPRRNELPKLRERGHQALEVMERHLAAEPFFVGASYSIADIALYAYTHVADEAGIDLAGYPAISAWLHRVQAQPGHSAMR